MVFPVKSANLYIDNLIHNIQDVLFKMCYANNVAIKPEESSGFKTFEYNMLHSNDRPHATSVHATKVAVYTVYHDIFSECEYLANFSLEAN